MQTAVMCVADLCSVFGNSLMPYIDTGSLSRPANSLLLQLLLKASSNDKRFVIDEVQLSLRTLAKSVDSAALLDRLLPYTAHRNPKVRAQVAIVLAASAEQMPPEDLAQYGNEKLLKVSGQLVTDNTQDARTAARELLSLLRKSHETAVTSPSTSEGEKDGEKENSPAPSNGFCGINKQSDSILGSKSVLAQNQSEPACSEACGVSPDVTWETFCKRTLAPSAAAAVLKVANK